MKYMIFEKKDDIGILRFNNPEKLNTLNSDFIKELHIFFKKLYLNKKIRALILTGEGKAFIGGADIDEMHNMNPKLAKDFSILGNSTFKLIQEFPLPVIAAVNGYALGGGLELVISADFAYASNRAKFGLPEVNLGLIPGWGACRRLFKRVGLSMAKELILTGKIINAEEALKIGLINKVTEPDILMECALKVATEIINASPNAIKEAKELINFCAESNSFSKSMLEAEIEKFKIVFSHPDVKEGTKAFIEKRKPVWGK